jgi:hypothetical protein
MKIVITNQAINVCEGVKLAFKIKQNNTIINKQNMPISIRDRKLRIIVFIGPNVALKRRVGAKLPRVSLKRLLGDS